ncbi:sensor histidine kinase [Sphingomonas abietis]|uniref:ATP-binding protein n=1 Tax=Sphingomonas abietis TaxID=3012344 RepID=A0ABY7NIP4_9SPHN|nr:ATP-binding protein [Sphingomonas abietis]WBO20685.1 ATP-binding protein [Sphingomonas abietis]
MHASQIPSPLLSPTARQWVHDLRSLFGVVASGCHSLGDLPPDNRSRRPLDAIERAAVRGRTLTADILTERKGNPGSLDVHRRLALLEPMLRVITGRTVDLRLDAREAGSLIRMPAEAFDTVLGELVVHAYRNLRTRGRILVRARSVAGAMRIAVAHNGRGMTNFSAPGAGGGSCSEADAQNMGLGRVHRFAGEAGGRLRVRSQRGRGNVVWLMLPLESGRLVPLAPINSFQGGTCADRSRIAA